MLGAIRRRIGCEDGDEIASLEIAARAGGRLRRITAGCSRGILGLYRRATR
jgi:hypothetical protein